MDAWDLLCDFIDLKGVQVASNYTWVRQITTQVNGQWVPTSARRFDYDLTFASDQALPESQFDPALLASGKTFGGEYKGRFVRFTPDSHAGSLESQLALNAHRQEVEDEANRQMEAHLESLPVGGPDIMPIYEATKRKAADEGKHVLVISTASVCQPCHMLARMFEDATIKPIVESRFEVLWVDCGEPEAGKRFENKNGETLCKQVGIWTGFPSYAAVAAGGKVLERSGTLGFPTRDTEIDRFLRVMNAGSKPLSSADESALRSYIASHKY